MPAKIFVFMIKRKLEDLITDLLKYFKIVFIAGARQVGKSTLARYLAGKLGYTYISLDDPEMRKTIKAAPDLFLATTKSKLVIDEIQKIPELIDYIKINVDTNEQKGQFILTGSTNIFHNPKIYESLAGRMVITKLYPFSAAELKEWDFNLVEILFRKDFYNFIKDLPVSDYDKAISFILKGRFPPVFNLDKFSNKWFSSYIEARINKDLNDLTEKKLHKLSNVKKLLKLLADRSAGLLNVNHISQELKTSYQTAKNYLTYLEALYLIEPLQPFYTNVGKQVIKQPKVYLMDTGLITYLLDLSESKFDFLSSDLGKLLETHVYLELKKEISYSQQEFQIFYFRDDKKNEVDFIIQNSKGELIAIEVKAKTAINSNDLKGLRVFYNRYADRISKLYIFYGGDKIGAEKLNDTVVYKLPWRILT